MSYICAQGLAAERNDVRQQGKGICFAAKPETNQRKSQFISVEYFQDGRLWLFKEWKSEKLKQWKKRFDGKCT